MKTYKILVIEEENNQGGERGAFDMLCRAENAEFKVVREIALDNALNRLRLERFQLVLLSFNFSKSSGLYNLGRLREADREIPVIVINGADEDILAAEAIKQGADEYMPKNQMGMRTLSRAIEVTMARAAKRPKATREEKIEASLQKEITSLKKQADRVTDLMKSSKLSSDNAEVVFGSLEEAVEKLTKLAVPMGSSSQDMDSEQRKNIKFLVVDDDPQLIARFVNRLKKMGFINIETAQNGEIAYDKCVTKLLGGPSYDIVISDWRMPRMTGIELLEKVRANSKLKNIIFMMVTAVDEVPLVKQALASDVNQYLIKPFKGEEFDQKIKSLIERKMREGSRNEDKKLLPDA